MIWLIFQSSIIFAVVASNIHWHWTPNEARQIASISLRQNHAGLEATGCSRATVAKIAKRAKQAA